MDLNIFHLAVENWLMIQNLRVAVISMFVCLFKVFCLTFVKKKYQTKSFEKVFIHYDLVIGIKL